MPLDSETCRQLFFFSLQVLINLHVPMSGAGEAPRRRAKTQVQDAIQRLWLYIQSVLVMETRNWRLVISRIGKIGHGEFRGEQSGRQSFVCEPKYLAWSQILSKTNLRAFNANFRGGRERSDHLGSGGGGGGATSSAGGGGGGLASAGLNSSASAITNCRACSATTTTTSELPIVLSACLLSMEAEAHLRVFASSSAATVDGALSSSGRAARSASAAAAARSLATLDSSITHIVVFPTSPEISTDPQAHNQAAAGDNEDFFGDFTTNFIDNENEFGDLLDAAELDDAGRAGKREKARSHIGRFSSASQ